MCLFIHGSFDNVQFVYLICRGDCRPFNMSVEAFCHDGTGKKKKKNFLRLERPCKCTMACFCRPILKVYDITGNEESFIGKLKDPWHMCNYTVKIYEGQHDDYDYYINGSCCQCGFHCHMPCGPCKEIRFQINDEKGNEVGEIKKVNFNAFININ